MNIYTTSLPLRYVTKNMDMALDKVITTVSVACPCRGQ
ncbi:unnamed protein product [Amoebophrya sp. A25]|nr:unnamed protein product [Amoebophrya sp. A25]|eukprot:GSA25T00001072001.1